MLNPTGEATEYLPHEVSRAPWRFPKAGMHAAASKTGGRGGGGVGGLRCFQNAEFGEEVRRELLRGRKGGLPNHAWPGPN